jgi:hypothetical protein
MTLDEHIEMCQRLREQVGHGQFETHFGYNYGDHWHTQVAPVAGDVQLAYVVRSDYHSMDKVMDEDKFHDIRQEHINEGLGFPEVDEEGNTGVQQYGHEVKQVVLIS